MTGYTTYGSVQCNDGVPTLTNIADSGTGMLGSFGKLLMDASAGTLLSQCWSTVVEGDNLSQCNNLNAFEQIVEEGSYSADESDNTDSSGDEDEIYCNKDIDTKWVQEVEDNIPRENFDRCVAVGCDYLGMDDQTCEELSEESGECEDDEVPERHDTTNIDDDEIPESMLGGCGCNTKEIRQEISNEYIESLKCGYQKRNSGGRTKGPDCRKPRDMGAIEIAMRTSVGKKGGHIFEPVLGMVFDSSEESYNFYNMYSWECGFGIIKSRCVRRQTDREYRSMQELRCERSGNDPRVNGSTKKINCKAKLKMLRTEDGGWYVNEFVKEHNHPMAEGCSEKREWFSHKRLDPYTLDMIRYLRENNVNQTRVRCILGSMFGGLKAAPCTKRTLRTICSQIAKQRMDDDVAKTMEVFRDMKANDPEFQWSVETIEESRINTLMWCSGKCREQYACFGDVVTFDTTYCTNVYKMPFGLFVGVNNHFQTVVFGGVLMRSETTESFEWVFKEFIKLMGGKEPKTILTDQCKAMTIALGRVWPGTFHMWCRWHVLKNIRESLGPAYTKNAQFRKEFYSIINEMMTKDEFDKAWDDLWTRHNLKENPFMIRTFQCRCKWAKPWSKGNFCAGMTSTQRSESANWMLKRFVPRNSSMNHFVSQFNILLQDREMEEGREENLTKQLFVKYSGLWPVERHAVKIYTRQTLKLFRKQVCLAANFKVSSSGVGFYIVERNSDEPCPEWRKKHYRINIYGGGERYFCECGFFEHVGILCCHTLRLMIHREVAKIPDIHVLTRWTRSAKDVVPEHMKFSAEEDPMTGAISVWQRRMNTKALEACTKGNAYRETYDIVMRHMNAAIKEVDEYIMNRKLTEEIEQEAAHDADMSTDMDNAKANRYGASGSSAGLSDTDIKNLRAPDIDRGRGRPRCNRLRSSAEKGIRKNAKKMSLRANKTVNKKKVGHKNSVKLKGKTNRDDGGEGSTAHRGLPFQSSFCTKCLKPGHGRNRCELNKAGSNEVKKCVKCGLKGHGETECLVVDEEYNGFFR